MIRLTEMEETEMYENTENDAAVTKAEENAGNVTNRCYTVQDLQTILGISRRSVYDLLRRKEFRWIQIGHGRYRISRKSFDEWLDRAGC